MKRLVEIIFCQQYRWNVKYALSEAMAAQQAVGLLCLFITTNFVSIYWLIEDMAGAKYAVSSPTLELGMMIGLPAVSFFVLSLLFLRKKRYIQIYRRRRKRHGSNSRGKIITYGYYALSILLFGIMVFRHLSASEA
ncbi:MAG TPA: hypothetical protein VGC95_13040 [Chitinophagaceae bacterium]|jgi:hypothetical protein